jgi:cytoskeleton-associated protein 5
MPPLSSSSQFLVTDVNHQTSLPDIIPDIMPALSSKNPQAKEGALKFMGRCLSSATTPIQTAQIKLLSETLATLVEDGYEGARNEAATCLGTLMKMVGERAMNPVLESLDDMRKAKVKEAYEKATVKCKIGAGGPPKAPAAPEALTKKPTAKKSAATKPASMSASVEEETTQQLKNKPATKGVRLTPSQ